MTDFEKFFKSWIDNKVSKQLKIIDEISKEIDIDSKDWFMNDFLSNSLGDHAGDEFLDVLLENFVCYLCYKFEDLFKGYIEPLSYSSYNNKPIYGMYISIGYNYKKNCLVIDGYNTTEEIQYIKKTLLSLTTENKIELMKNKLFVYIINNTKFDVFTDKEIRKLKLKNLNEICF